MSSIKPLAKSFFTINVIITAILFAWCVQTSSMSERNYFFLHYSLERFLLNILILILLFVFLFCRIYVEKKEITNLTSKLLQSQMICIVCVCLTLIFSFLIFGSIKKYFGPSQILIERLMPIFIFGLFFSLEILVFQQCLIPGNTKISLRQMLLSFFRINIFETSKQSNGLGKAAIGYLTLPFAIFCLLFLRIWIGIPFFIILGWITWRIGKAKKNNDNRFQVKKIDLMIGLVLLSTWVFLSGIGGFAFQNSDFHIRNAIFRDLVTNNWPVYFPTSNSLPVTESFALIYYIGFWLPSALVGKVFGMEAANVVLFFWALLGVFLTSAMLKERIRSTFFSSSALLVFFSGMDVLGVLVSQYFVPGQYPTLWPPITHLEWWARISQYSSSTTQLFWVFNQAIPAWIGLLLILNSQNRRFIFFIWSLCFFSSPLPSVGLIPFVLLAMRQESLNPATLSMNWKGIKPINQLRGIFIEIGETISLENILGGILVLGTSYTFFSTNQSASKISFLHLDSDLIILFIAFLAIEGLILWMLVFKEKRNDLWWYVTGVVLIFAPLIRMGGGNDFCMRVSIPALFILMVWSGEALFTKPYKGYRNIIILLLIIGAVTPLYEINRSIYRTIKFYFQDHTITDVSSISQEPELPNPIPELDHESTLTADLYPSLTVFRPEQIQNFSGNIENSFFFRYLAKPPE